MNHEELRQDLTRLHAELKQISSLDQSERGMLLRLEAEIDEVLARDDEHPQSYGGLGEQIGKAMAQLEVSHPRTTLLMQRVVDSLAYLGV
ncbi:MAG: DUF4404 family protein [Acidobacteriota bacterium]